MPHLNNKQNKNTNPVISKQDCHSLSLAYQRKTRKQTNKLSTILILYKANTNQWINLRREEAKRKKKFNLLQGKNSTVLEAWKKETSNIITYKK